jgi:hypothetical protein
MKKYLVSVPMAATVVYEIEAESPEQAREEAFESVDAEDFDFDIVEDQVTVEEGEIGDDEPEEGLEDDAEVSEEDATSPDPDPTAH